MKKDIKNNGVNIELLELARDNAVLFVRDWLDYFNIDVSGIDFDRLKGHSKRSFNGENSYNAVYSHTVEWLIWQIKVQRETEAIVLEQYDEDGYIIVSNL